MLISQHQEEAYMKSKNLFLPKFYLFMQIFIHRVVIWLSKAQPLEMKQKLLLDDIAILMKIIVLFSLDKEQLEQFIN